MIGQLERENPNIIVHNDTIALSMIMDTARVTGALGVSRLDLELFSSQPDSPDFCTGTLGDR